MKGLASFIPALDWLKNYKKENLRGDVNAGLTVAVMLIPQGMAYAMLAGLPPIIGLYASIVPLAIYALLGTSRQLAVGPVAMVSLLVATGVGAVAKSTGISFLSLAILLALMVGAMQLFMGLARLGFLVNFLSHPVISGFTSAAALIIGLSQLKHVLGVDLARSHHIHAILWEAIQKVSQINVPTFLLGLGGIVFLVLMKRWKPAFPSALFLVLGSTLLVWGLGLNVKIVKDVPAGLPTPQLPIFSWAAIKALLPTALVISLVGFMESISVAKAFASKNRYLVDANQELVALGSANLAGAFFQAYPVTGGFSRTAVNAQAGAKTGLASLLTALMLALTLLFLTPLFYFLPKAVLGSVVMVAVAGLVDVKELFHLWKVKRSDAFLLLLTFGATLSLGIEQGIGVGVIVSLAVFIFRSTRPHTAELGRLPGTDVYRNVERFSEARKVDRVAIFRIDASFYFANVAFFRDQISTLRLENEDLKAVIVDASGINDIDASADEALHEIARDLKEVGIDLYLASVKGPVRDVLRRSKFYDVLGEDHFTFTVQEAVDHAQRDNGDASDVRVAVAA